MTADSARALKKTWWAPTNPAYCPFVIQCLRVYSYDGLSHGGLAIGEGIDWDIPSDDGADNTGGSDATRRMIYARGTETDNTGCQLNTDRYGAQALLAT